MTSLPDPKPITVGIDVSKATLDVAIGVKATPLSASNKTDGFDTLLEELARHRVALIVLEATGGLEMAVACVLQAAGYAVAVINSIHVRRETLLVRWGNLRRLIASMLAFSPSSAK